MLFKEKLLVVWVIAIVVLGFLATHAMHYVIEALSHNCAFGLASIANVMCKLGGVLATLWNF